MFYHLKFILLYFKAFLVQESLIKKQVPPDRDILIIINQHPSESELMAVRTKP